QGGPRSVARPCGHGAPNAPAANSCGSCHAYSPSCTANTSVRFPKPESHKHKSPPTGLVGTTRRFLPLYCLYCGGGASKAAAFRQSNSQITRKNILAYSNCGSRANCGLRPCCRNEVLARQLTNRR